jgi:acetolactate synthase small subunit
MTHFLVVTLNQNGVLARITSVVSALGTNIETMAAYPVAGSEYSIVHLHVDAETVQADRIRRKLSRLVDVLEVRMDEEQTPLSIDFGAIMAGSASLSRSAAQKA